MSDYPHRWAALARMTAGTLAVVGTLLLMAVVGGWAGLAFLERASTAGPDAVVAAPPPSAG